MCIHPLDPQQHPENIINIVNGMIGPSSVNVDEAIDIGTRQMKEFEESLPDGFYETISKKVETMAITKKSFRVGDSKVYNTELIYSRVIGLQASSREVNITDVMSCELSPIPTGLFSDSGDMRISKSKSTLKNLTKVDASSRQAAKEATCTAIDGCALLWIPRWPSSTSTKQPLVLDYVNKFKDHIKEKLKKGDTYLVFDKYNNYSTKSSTRIARMAEGCKVFQLSPTAPLPSQKICLTITQNKKQLIDIICKDLQTDQDFHSSSTQKHKLMITGQQEAPVEISFGGIVIQRCDIATTHEEADNIIVQQAVTVAMDEQKQVTVLADDTDVCSSTLSLFRTGLTATNGDGVSSEGKNSH